MTGAARGIGRSIALAFARSGADLALAGRNQATVEATAAEVRQLGRQAIALAGDVSSMADVQRWVNETVAYFGQLDILVNNAGWRMRHPFLEFPEEVMDRIIAVCLKGPFLCSQAAARVMVKQGGGRIINISSNGANRGTVRTAAYSAAKGGLNALTYVMATELAPHGISVNAVAPGLIDTPHQGTDKTNAELQAVVRRIPLGRMGHPDEIAALVVYLASDAAAWVTGSIFPIDGGFTAAGVFPERL